jgi:hypothetical protein
MIPPMGSSKFDAALSSALARASLESVAPADGPYEVTVRMTAPLTPEQAALAAQHGVQADTRRTIYSTRLDASALHRLAQEPYVRRLSLSQQLRPLPGEGEK